MKRKVRGYVEVIAYHWQMNDKLISTILDSFSFTSRVNSIFAALGSPAERKNRNVNLL